MKIKNETHPCDVIKRPFPGCSIPSKSPAHMLTCTVSELDDSTNWISPACHPLKSHLPLNFTRYSLLVLQLHGVSLVSVVFAILQPLAKVVLEQPMLRTKLPLAVAAVSHHPQRRGSTSLKRTLVLFLGFLDQRGSQSSCSSHRIQCR